MDSSPKVEVRYCFVHNDKAHSQYICYKHESCCTTGCCPSYPYKYLESWYFWLFVVIFFFIYYMISWYCKKLVKRRVPEIRSAIHCSHPEVNSQRYPQEPNEIFLNQLFQSYRNHYVQAQQSSTSSFLPPKNEPPPKYQDALLMPKPHKSEDHVVLIPNEVQLPVSQNNILTRNDSNLEDPLLPSYELATSQREQKL